MENRTEVKQNAQAYQEPERGGPLGTRAAPSPAPARPESPTQVGRLDPYAPAHFDGVASLALTDQERAILTKDPDQDEIEYDEDRKLWYFGHAAVRLRLNSAFGPGTWGLVPVGPPIAEDAGRDKYGNPITLVLSTWDLYVRRVFISRATGEMSYIPGNARMSRGDALEGSKSNALVRACKDLGIGIQLHAKKYRAKLDAARRGGAQQVENRPPVRKSAAAKPKPAEAQAPPATNGSAAPAAEQWSGKLGDYSIKTGQGKSGPWTLHSFVGHDGSRFGTFSDSTAAALIDAVDRQSQVEIGWKTTSKGNREIVVFRVVDDEPEVVYDMEPDQEGE